MTIDNLFTLQSKRLKGTTLFSHGCSSWPIESMEWAILLSKSDPKPMIYTILVCITHEQGHSNGELKMSALVFFIYFLGLTWVVCSHIICVRQQYSEGPCTQCVRVCVLYLSSDQKNRTKQIRLFFFSLLFFCQINFSYLKIRSHLRSYQKINKIESFILT